jgi:hypothetical protein
MPWAHWSDSIQETTMGGKRFGAAFSVDKQTPSE